MKFKDFFKSLSLNLDLGSNREERMRSLLSLVLEVDPGFEETEDDPVMTPSADTLNQIASGRRSFNADIAEPVLRSNYEPGGQLALAKEQVEAWEATEALKTAKKQAEVSLNEARKTCDRQIEDKPNADIVRLDRLIHGESGDWYPPVFAFSETGKSYTYGSEVDNGTGTTGKNLILIDLAMLALTPLPYVIHDHPLHQSIENKTVGRLLTLYLQFTNKQIFIAFDKDEHYEEAPEVNRIITQTAVIELGKEHEALYGWTWNKKPNKAPAQEEGAR